MAHLYRISKRLPLPLVVGAASFVVALLFAVLSVSRFAGFPPRLEPRSFATGGASMHVMLDFTPSRIADRGAEWDYFNAPRVRTRIVAQLMASAPAIEYVARRAGLAETDIAAFAPVTIAVPGALTEPGSEQRAREILLASKAYRLEIQGRPNDPFIDIYAQAPSPSEAQVLAQAAVTGFRDYLHAADAARGIETESPIQLIALGQPQAVGLTSGSKVKVAALAFMLAFGVAFAVLWLVARAARRPGPEDASEPGATAPTGRMATVIALRPHAPRIPGLGPDGTLAIASLAPGARLTRPTFTRDGDWPHTTRILPWLLAGFMAMLWLVPFDSIQLNVPSPIDLKLDRVALPAIAVLWLLSLLLGGRVAPQISPTRIHAALGAFVAIAFLSVILNAEPLNQSLELDTSVKKLPLLLSYMSVFVIMASAIRRGEVPAFLKLMLGLAVLCGIGMVVEFRLDHNFFFEWPRSMLPGIFDVAGSEGGYDGAGRRVVHGPTSHPLAAAAILGMAIPTAVVGLIHTPRMRDRILYGLAAGILMVAMLSTQRKTGLLAPVSGVLTLAWFRRRELLRLTPLAVVALIAVLIISPGTIMPVIDQFRPGRLGADTVSDRASDYDAIRPDVWSHFALGRGYGAYQPIGHRILDSEVLVRLVEMGVIGLVAFVVLGAAVVSTARKTINSRHPIWGPPALAGAAAAVVFLMLATLFDIMSFAQVPYIFLCFAALVAALSNRR